MSWIINIFAKMFAFALAGRIIGIIISIIVAFVIYKAIVDPRFFSRSMNSFNNFLDSKKIEKTEPANNNSSSSTKDKLLDLVK